MEEKIEKTKIENSESNSKKIVKRVLLWLLIAILVFLVGCVGWIFIDKYIRKSPAPSLFGYSQFVVVTASMSGTIEEGDLVITKKTSDYQIGDIITFLFPGDTVPTTHRIILIDGDNIYTKGDAMETADVLPITEEDILGEVVGRIPKLGLFANWISHGGGIFYIIAIVVIIVAGCVFIKLSKKKKDDDELKGKVETDEGVIKDAKKINDKERDKQKENNES